jgi:inosine/xanthosine triphosphatase
VRIAVGSTNRIKVQAVEEVVSLFPEFATAEVISYAASSEVSRQPISWRETTEGARNRAKNCFDTHEYSIGIESGLFFREEWFNVVAVVVYDGKKFFTGYSSIFSVPVRMIDYVLSGMEMCEATQAVGLSEDAYIGHREGVISKLTAGNVVRLDLVKQGLLCALPAVLFPDLYAIASN